MKYVALLRGVNIGGKKAVKMSRLKEVFEEAKFSNVSTYINSGNILFEDETEDIRTITKKIQSLLEKNFFPIDIVVISQKELKKIEKAIPSRWIHDDVRKYIAFLIPPVKPEDVIKEAQLKDGVDFLDKGPGVVYMTTLMSGLTKSYFSKLVAKKIYKSLTIRNYNTTQKLLSLMD